MYDFPMDTMVNNIIQRFVRFHIFSSLFKSSFVLLREFTDILCRLSCLYAFEYILLICLFVQGFSVYFECHSVENWTMRQGRRDSLMRFDPRIYFLISNIAISGRTMSRYIESNPTIFMIMSLQWESNTMKSVIDSW